MSIKKRRMLLRLLAGVFAAGLVVAAALGFMIWRLLDPPPGALAAPIRTPNGWVQGLTRGGITSYRGIPFAAPPIGDLRWRPPQPVLPWDGTLAATEFKTVCIQEGETVPGLGVEPMSEDCLYLNVWTPARDETERLPVMVWLYGGGNHVGSGSARLYWGDRLARHGVVVVTLNYRLGAFGMMAHPELSTESGNGVSGNYLLLDQIAALRWVQDNIAAFGGDPATVTLFGQSAGASATLKLIVSPLTRGLFHRAIAHSGGDLAPVGSDLGNTISLADAERIGVQFAQRFNARSIAGLRQVPAEEIHARDGGELFPDGTPRGPHRINADGYVVPGGAYELYTGGAAHDVPLLAGYNAGEQSLPQRWPIRTWALLHTRTEQSPVFLYYFSRVPPFPPFRFSGMAGHGAELPYLFGFPDPVLFYFLEFPWNARHDNRIAQAMQTYWTNFAKTGDPNGGGLPAWPDFRTGRVMELGDAIGAIEIPDKREHEEMDAEMARLRGQ